MLPPGAMAFLAECERSLAAAMSPMVEEDNLKIGKPVDITRLTPRARITGGPEMQHQGAPSAHHIVGKSQAVMGEVPHAADHPKSVREARRIG